jgi:hypothetical protein
MQDQNLELFDNGISLKSDRLKIYGTGGAEIEK